MLPSVEEKLKAMTGILKQARISFKAAEKTLEPALPEFPKQIKLKSRPKGAGSKIAIRKAHEALDHVMRYIIWEQYQQNYDKTPKQCIVARQVDLLDWEQFAKVSGVTISTSLTPAGQALTRQPYDYREFLPYKVDYTITNPELPLAVAIQEYKITREKQLQDLSERRKKAAEALERAQLAVLDEFPAMIEGGLGGLALPHDPGNMKEAIHLWSSRY